MLSTVVQLRDHISRPVAVSASSSSSRKSFLRKFSADASGPRPGNLCVSLAITTCLRECTALDASTCRRRHHPCCVTVKGVFSGSLGTVAALKSFAQIPKNVFF